MRLVPVPSQPETASKSMERTTRILGVVGEAAVDSMVLDVSETPVQP